MSASAKIGLVSVLVLIITVAVVWDGRRDSESPDLSVVSQVDPGTGLTAMPEYVPAVPATPAGATITNVVPMGTAGNTGTFPAPITTVEVPGFGNAPAPQASFQVAMTPTQMPAAIASTPDTYKVVDGDSFWKIAQKVYSDGSKWETIANANKAVCPDPTRLREGMVLTIPPAPVPASARKADAVEAPRGGAHTDFSPGVAPGGRTYTVEAGDSLFSIAAKVYGTGSRWKTIYEANHDKIADPHRLKTGMVLTIPADK